MSSNNTEQQKDIVYLNAKNSIAELEKKYSKKLIVNKDLDRSLVSFQANKNEPIFRWFHYREGFSKPLIEYIFNTLRIPKHGVLLDPFAGTGVAPFVAANSNNMRGIAIELMPVGSFFMRCRNSFSNLSKEKMIDYANKALLSRNEWLKVIPRWRFKHLKITEGAFSKDSEYELCQFKTWLESVEDKNFKLFLDFLVFTILEQFSYTRKDGQYLRWDYRSPRFENKVKKTNFNKGIVLSFSDAISNKLRFIINDLNNEIDEFTNNRVYKNEVSIIEGSVLKEINYIENESIDVIITSPPYCNRYDYTRTYALELAYLGIGEDDIRKLRQTLLTCTVENKPKSFDWLAKEEKKIIDNTYSKQKCLIKIIDFLDNEAKAGRLNNKGIKTMVEGYFYDTIVHLYQASQKMKKDSYYIMVNDNVKYNGLDIPIDLLLSEIASEFNLKTEKIWVLPKGKGNSSQQMKKHGRTELRKCIYIWKKA